MATMEEIQKLMAQVEQVVFQKFDENDKRHTVLMNGLQNRFHHVDLCPPPAIIRNVLAVSVISVPSSSSYIGRKGTRRIDVSRKSWSISKLLELSCTTWNLRGCHCDCPLAYPDFSKKFIIQLDASKLALGATLSQGVYLLLCML